MKHKITKYQPSNINHGPNVKTLPPPKKNQKNKTKQNKKTCQGNYFSDLLVVKMLKL